MANELKPCPFCGGEAELVRSSQFVRCKTDDCYFYTSAVDINKWNTRTQPPAVSELVEGLMPILGSIEFHAFNHLPASNVRRLIIENANEAMQALANYKKEGE